jgi:hypothetical protein
MSKQPVLQDRAGEPFSPTAIVVTAAALAAAAVGGATIPDWRIFSVGLLAVFAVSNPGWSWFREPAPGNPAAWARYRAKVVGSGLMLLVALGLAGQEPVAVVRGVALLFVAVCLLLTAIQAHGQWRSRAGVD